jgi:hypothetical protein
VREIVGVVVVAAAVFAAVGSADSTSGRIVVIPRSPVVGVRARIEFRGRALLPASRRLILIVSPDTGTAARLRLVRAARGIWRGSFSFPYLGRWRLRVAARRTILAATTVTARAPAASTFQPPGEPGCAPPSPANQTTREARGVASNGDLWALFFVGFTSARTAVLSPSVVGKRTKIVWRMLGSGDATFTAVAPGGARIAPVNVQLHDGGSTWTRPGREWGTEFVFSQPGCWQLHAQRSDGAGDLWVLLRS